MKTILKIKIIFATFLLFSSCHSDLNVIQKGGVSTSEAWQTSDDAIAAMYGMTSTCRAAFATNYIYWGEYRTGLWGQGIENQVARDQVYANTIPATHAQADWQSLYTTINHANLILKYAPTLSFPNQSNRSMVMGNAHFVRAFCYYWIARIWGDAPLLLAGFESDKQDNLYPTRSAVADIFAQVEADLLKAEEFLEGVSLPANIASIDAVRAMQVDLYLWLYVVMNDSSALAKARTACTAAIGKKSLLPDFGEVFSVKNKLNNEIIFAWTMKRDEKEGGYPADWLVPLQYVTPTYVENPVKVGSHQQWVFITDEYKNLFSSVASDSRRTATYETFEDSGKNVTHQWINKFAGTWDSSLRIFDSDIVVYRYADIVLFDAEIKLLQGDKDAAIDALNIVAKRAYKVDDYYKKSMDQYGVKEAIIAERMKEFCGEGKLWWDFIRMGVVFEIVPSLIGREDHKNALLWPISQNSLNDNPNLKQTEIEY